MLGMLVNEVLMLIERVRRGFIINIICGMDVFNCEMIVEFCLFVFIIKFGIFI